MIEVIVAGKHALLRVGLTQILETDDDITVRGQAGDWQELDEKLPRESAVVVIVNSEMGEEDDFQAMQSLSLANPDVRFLVLGGTCDAHSLRAAVHAGASGFLLNDIHPADFLRCVHLVACGAVLWSPQAAAYLIEAIGKRERCQPEQERRPLELSTREQEILELLATVESPRQIAGRLQISPKTVQNHIGSIYRKLGARSRTDAVVRSVQSGLVSL